VTRRRLPAIEHVIRRAPRLQAATNRAIDAVLGKPKRRKQEFPEPGSIDQLFREARRNRA
jgi:hypothetical protein